MGMLALNRLMSMQRRPRQIRSSFLLTAASPPHCELIASTGKRKGSPCEQDGDSDSQVAKIMRFSIPDLPEDILSCIHSLMPMREAARAAFLSRAFLRSWRCHPNLVFNKDTIGLKRSSRGENFHHKIDRILKNHSGISLKSFKLDYSGMCGFDGTSYLDTWLQIALKPGIEELTLWLSNTRRKYNFPCPLLSDGVKNSLRYLKLRFCALHPTAELGPFRRLRSLHLFFQLTTLNICECSSLKALESKAPNLSNFFHRGFRVNFSCVETLQIKKLDMERPNFIRDARSKLPFIMPNLETLVIESGHEVVDAPMLHTKFLYLKHLTICLISGSTISRPYNYFSLVSFLEASPSLETLILDVIALRMAHESIFADSELRYMPEHRLGCLKSVKISGFSSAKSLVELTCYILKNAVSLECLTLDTIYGPRCY
ncbi:unnamed protein product [Urochloa decumbens]|uniref:At1g61320/AtMIF1 LRR domain-containing protein n=1 Tax=Urochloa decumbens TaxID=240449 RepID=A0ABC9BXF4_9POAL